MSSDARLLSIIGADGGVQKVYSIIGNTYHQVGKCQEEKYGDKDQINTFHLRTRLNERKIKEAGLNYPDSNVKLMLIQPVYFILLAIAWLMLMMWSASFSH